MKILRTSIEKDQRKKDIDNFITQFTKESVYILGLLWADGSSYKPNHRIGLVLKNCDMEEIKPTLAKTFGWGFYERKLEEAQTQPIVYAYISNKKLFTFLENLDFCEKSTKSPDKLLSLMPEYLHKYFFRGIIDGDGCFHVNKKYFLYHFVMTSSINQDWSYFVKMLDSLDIKYKVKQSSSLNKKQILNSCSRILVTSRKEIIKLIDFIYNDYSNDKIGFTRKYEISKLISF